MAIATYKDAGAILDEAKQIQLHLATQDASIGALLDKIGKHVAAHSSAPTSVTRNAPCGRA